MSNWWWLTSHGNQGERNNSDETVIWLLPLIFLSFITSWNWPRITFWFYEKSHVTIHRKWYWQYEVLETLLNRDQNLKLLSMYFICIKGDLIAAKVFLQKVIFSSIFKMSIYKRSALVIGKDHCGEDKIYPIFVIFLLKRFYCLRL